MPKRSLAMTIMNCCLPNNSNKRRKKNAKQEAEERQNQRSQSRSRSRGRALSRGRSRRSSLLTESSSSAPADLMVLAKEGQFDEILTRLGGKFDNDDHTSRFGSSLYISNASDAAFPLHAILRHRPTVAVVDALIRRLQQDVSSLAPAVLVPEEVRETTVLQQTPLHVAVASQCSVAVLERLLEGESLVMPAMAKDGLHRFPLHWATCGGSSTTDSSSTKSDSPNKKRWKLPRMRNNTADADYRWDVVHLLLHQYPVAAVIPDVYNQTPLDYARQHKLDSDVIELIEEAAMEYERYAPPRPMINGKKTQTLLPFREHTEATSLVTESELIPNELPTVVMNRSPTKKQQRHHTSSQWFAAAASAEEDEVSSLGGDYPSASSIDNGGLTQVTSLFSSALVFGSTASTTTEDGPHNHHHQQEMPVESAPPTTATSTKLPVAKAQPLLTRPPPMTPTQLLYGFVQQEDTGSSEEQSNNSLPSDPAAAAAAPAPAAADEQQEVHCCAVRTKTLLKGNLQIKRPGSRRNLTTELAVV